MWIANLPNFEDGDETMEIRCDKSRSVQFAAMGVCGLLLASWAPAARATNEPIGEPGRKANGPNGWQIEPVITHLGR